MKNAMPRPEGRDVPAKARFLEIRAGRLKTEQLRDGFSSRLALSKPFTAAPTD